MKEEKKKKKHYMYQLWLHTVILMYFTQVVKAEKLEI